MVSNYNIASIIDSGMTIHFYYRMAVSGAHYHFSREHAVTANKNILPLRDCQVNRPVRARTIADPDTASIIFHPEFSRIQAAFLAKQYSIIITHDDNIAFNQKTTITKDNSVILSSY
jgi:hypothetical protein